MALRVVLARYSMQQKARNESNYFCVPLKMFKYPEILMSSLNL
jgi:hypothetical protein